ncbi:MAG: divalent-cation tolerance protein CutA [Pirellulaceae bacterium]|nr:divalent-cation tolerance protein CutA [Pirellulaceae bacterium]
MNTTRPTGLICCTSTVATQADADRIAQQLIERSMAACVQIDGPISSHYRWQGEQHCDTEFRLTIKSSANVWPELKACLAEIHPYDEPQILMIPIADASAGYRAWVLQQTARS